MGEGLGGGQKSGFGVEKANPGPTQAQPDLPREPPQVHRNPKLQIQPDRIPNPKNPLDYGVKQPQDSSKVKENAGSR